MSISVVLRLGLDRDGHALDPGAFHKIQHVNDGAMRGVPRAADVNRQIGVETMPVGKDREQVRETKSVFWSSATWPSRFTVRLMMSGLAVDVARVAVGRLALSVRTFCICRLTIMNEASKKNMMSIKGMISRRVRLARQWASEFSWHVVGLRSAADHERHLLNPRAADGLVHIGHRAMKGVRSPLMKTGRLVSSRKRLLSNEAQFRQGNLFLLQPDPAGLVHGDIDHVRLEVVLRLRSRPAG